VALRARGSITVRSVAAQSIGEMASGIFDPVARDANCVGFLIPLVRRIVIERNFPMRLCWFPPSRVFAE